MEIRSMRPGEELRLQELAQSVGWNQSVEDCRMLVLSPWSRMICVEEKGEIIATAGAVIYENTMGFINMVIVHPDYRKRGIASAMIRHFLENLQVKTFRLHATPAGSFVYSKLGFVTTRTMSYIVGKNPDFGPASPEVRPATAADLPGICALDRKMFGLSREGLFADNLQRFGKFALKLEYQDRLQGFALGRRGTKHRQIAAVETAEGEGAFELIAAAAPLEKELETNLIIFDADRSAFGRLEKAGMSKVRELIEMEYGVPGTPPGAGYHAIYGGDFG